MSNSDELFTRDELQDKFGWEEYLMFALLLLVSVAIGVFYWWRGQKSNLDFLLGGKDIGTLPITISLVVSFMSAVTLLGTPGEIYVYGTQYALLVASYPFVMGATAHMFMPVFYDLNVSTSYEYLEWRFNKHVRALGAFCFMLYMTLYIAIVVYAPALAISTVIGFDVDLACAVIFVICIFYTSLGGIKAVVWTDVFQAVIMFGSFLTVIIIGNFDAGGWSEIIDINYRTDRLELFNFSFDMTERHTVWGLVIGGYFYWMTMYGVNQTMVQRYLTIPTKGQAQKAIWWNGLGIGSLLLMCAYAGLTIFAYYGGREGEGWGGIVDGGEEGGGGLGGGVGCDPLEAGQVESRDQLFPFFVMQVFGDVSCLPGIFVAGVFSGSLSTVSSGLNSLAGVTMVDYIEGYFGKDDLSDRATLWATKGLAVFFGLVCYGFVYVAKYLPGVLEAALAIAGMTGGPALGGFTLGMFFPWANSVGAFVGMASSLVFTLWLGMAQTVALYVGAYAVPTKEVSLEGCPEDWYQDYLDKEEDDVDGSWFHHLKFYEVSYIWFSAISCMWAFVVGAVVSFLTGPQDPKKLNPKLISPGFLGLFSIWPRPVRDFLEGLEIGRDYVPSEKEARLRSKQLLKNIRDEEEDFRDVATQTGEEEEEEGKNEKEVATASIKNGHAKDVVKLA